ncbi:MAG: spore coat protein [Clostridia bacterium]|nr:spore coat protein [Clostridia bacterium]
MSWTQKETTLLKDLKSYEATSVTKYGEYADRACDGELKNLFTSLKQTQQNHLDTLNRMLGESGGCGGSDTCPIESSSQGFPANASSNNASGSCDGSGDRFLCHDALSSEKYASSLYDVCLFEFSDQASRDTLHRIQGEEQHNGKQLYDYMSAHNMMA